MDPKAYFDMLVDWKKLPAYKLEPRVDSLVGYYLPEILQDYLGDKIAGIIPELPLRKGTLNPELNDGRHADLSTRVDFYALGESGIHYLIEMKSDSGSRRDSQDDYLQKACEWGMGNVVEGSVRISNATSSKYKKKYNCLKAKLCGMGVLDDQDQFIAPCDTVKVIYVQPRALDGDESHVVIDFEHIAKWLRVNCGDNEFALGLAGALEAWAVD